MKPKIPNKLIHGTTSNGVLLIQENGIQSRGFSRFGKQNPPRSMDFGEGFYCSYDDKIGTKQVSLRAETKAKGFGEKPQIIDVKINDRINYDEDLKWVHFNGGFDVDGLKWAKYIAFHRVHKDQNLCIKYPCDGHPDIIIGL